MSDVNPSQKPDDDKTTDEQALERERYEVLKGLIDWLETPMLLLPSSGWRCWYWN
jgi:hypothetical protein